jgi:hypothetical protein
MTLHEPGFNGYLTCGCGRTVETPVEHENADTGRVGIEFVAADIFAATDEPDAEALVVDANGSTVIPSAGSVMVYGAGGAGKTTLELDLACHLAAGADWLDGLLRPVRPLTIGWVENEGPRREFRLKVGRKLANWGGRLDPERLQVLTEPWAGLTLRDETRRAELAAAIEHHHLDLLIAGPLHSLGMVGGGTPDDINVFESYIADLQARLPRRIAISILHHDNRAGKVSGAWEARPDLLVHVQGAGHGHLRVFWQKSRWSSALHATTTRLAWADGEGFALEEEGPARPERTWDDIAAYVLEHGGTSWSPVEEAVEGTATYLRDRRRQMLDAGVLFDVGQGQAFELWHRDDPLRPTDFDEPRRDADGVSTGSPSTTGDGGIGGTPSARRPVRDDGVPTTRSPGASDVDEDET